jgi:uncharacterized protein (TIGR01244 family)
VAKARAAVLATASLFAASVGLADTADSIDHFVRVDGRVCTGGQPTDAQLASLSEEGIRTVIDLRQPSEQDLEAEAAAVRKLGLRFVSIPVSGADPKAEQADAFLAATEDPSVFPLFVHCASGNRVGAFWMIRRVLVDGWSEAKAEEEARRIGLRSPNLVAFARDYIRTHSR